MGLFSRKPKVDAVVFCRELYDRFVFAPKLGETEPHIAQCQVAQRLITEADPVFARVDLANFASEMLALRMEVIGVAWSQGANPKLALIQSKFTKSYLVDTRRAPLWEQMSHYNAAVARSATHGDDSKSPAGRAHIAYINSMRASMFDGYVTEGYDGEVAARVANRFGSAGKWGAGVTRGFLTLELMARLKYEGSSDEAGLRLSAQAEAFYRGATEALAEVQLTM